MASQQFHSRDILFSPEAFWFGSEQHPLLGWFHPANRREAGGSRRCGVLLCAPFGHEYMVSYLSYKHLAQQLSRAGYDVLFFDYNNSGDSADLDGPQLQIWQQNIRSAARQLQQLSDCQQLVLFGLRLGGLLAGSLADELQAAGLILFAPVISGRAYSRELQVLRQMSGLTQEAGSDLPAHRRISDDELTGYHFSAETKAALSKLDLSKLAAPNAPVLVIARDDVAGQEARLAEAWQSERLSLQQTAGYAAMMTEDAHDSQPPLAVWNAILGWLDQHFSLTEALPASPLNPADQLGRQAAIAVGQQSIVEQAVLFDGLSGILSHPAGGCNNHLPAVVLVNIGANHRVGNHRLYVNLARQLGLAGFTVLRFDKSGIGHSKATPEGRENDVYAEAGLQDLNSATEFLRSAFRFEQFILGGLCSGAYFAYLAALQNPHIKGVILMNQLVYHWRAGDTLEKRKQESIKSSHFYARAIRDPETWKRLLRGQIQFRQISMKLSQRIGKRLHLLSQAYLNRFAKNPVFLGKVARHFHHLEKRGTEILMIMDAADSSVDLMTENFGRHGVLLGNSERIRLEIFSGSDHTFTPLWAQQHVIQTISRHLQQRFAPDRADSEK